MVVQLYLFSSVAWLFAEQVLHSEQSLSSMAVQLYLSLSMVRLFAEQVLHSEQWLISMWLCSSISAFSWYGCDEWLSSMVVQAFPPCVCGIFVMLCMCCTTCSCLVA
jgi:hypothetical protein